MAIDGLSICAHRVANSSGNEAPSRKLNAERACSSMYSVISALNEPGRRQSFAVDSIQASVVQADVPVITVPWVVGPPIARCAPWTRRLQHIPVHALRIDPRGTFIFHFDTGRHGREEISEREAGVRYRFADGRGPGAGGYRFDRPCALTMCIQDARTARIAV